MEWYGMAQWNVCRMGCMQNGMYAKWVYAIWVYAKWVYAKWVYAKWDVTFFSMFCSFIKLINHMWATNQI